MGVRLIYYHLEDNIPGLMLLEYQELNYETIRRDRENLTLPGRKVIIHTTCLLL
jgi:hypothetical protein